MDVGHHHPPTGQRRHGAVCEGDLLDGRPLARVVHHQHRAGRPSEAGGPHRIDRRGPLHQGAPGDASGLQQPFAGSLVVALGRHHLALGSHHPVLEVRRPAHQEFGMAGVEIDAVEVRPAVIEGEIPAHRTLQGDAGEIAVPPALNAPGAEFPAHHGDDLLLVLEDREALVVGHVDLDDRPQLVLELELRSQIGRR